MVVRVDEDLAAAFVAFVFKLMKLRLLLLGLIIVLNFFELDAAVFTGVLLAELDVLDVDGVCDRTAVVDGLLSTSTLLFDVGGFVSDVSSLLDVVVLGDDVDITLLLISFDVWFAVTGCLKPALPFNSSVAERRASSNAFTLRE